MEGQLRLLRQQRAEVNVASLTASDRLPHVNEEIQRFLEGVSEREGHAPLLFNKRNLLRNERHRLRLAVANQEQSGHALQVHLDVADSTRPAIVDTHLKNVEQATNVNKNAKFAVTSMPSKNRKTF